MEKFNYYRNPEGPPPEKQRGLYYEMSGKFEWPRLITAWGIGLCCLVPLSFGYGFLQHKVQDKANFLQMLFMIGIEVVLVIAVNHLSRNRNPRMCTLTGLVFAMTIICFSWIGWTFYYSGNLLQALRPDIILETAWRILHSTNYWQVKANTSTIVIVLIWLTEGGMFVLAGFIASFFTGTFCEECRKYVRQVFESENLHHCFELEDMKKSLEAHDFSQLLRLPQTKDRDKYIKLQVSSCGCGATYLLSSAKVTVTRGGKRKHTSYDWFVIDLYISREEFTEITGHFQSQMDFHKKPG